MLIMLDGNEGSGKSTIIKEWKKYLTNLGNPIFDLKKYWQEMGKHPKYSELKSYDFIFGHEPTGTRIGLEIRNELIQKENNYPPRAIADSYSLDRLIFYTKIIIPALKDNKCVVLDRGISSSLAYQSLQKGLNMEIISKLTGNKLALKYPPDHLIIAEVKPETGLNRLSRRTEKQDNAIFEKLEFMKRLDKQYHNKEFIKIFNKLGTQIHYLSTDVKIDIMKEQSINLFKKLINNI